MNDNPCGKKTGLQRLLPAFFRIVGVLAFLCLTENAAGNTGNQYTLNINIDGTIVANGSCSFNQGSSVTVDFGEVKLKSTGSNTVTLDGDYQRPLASTFTCTGDMSGLLQMKFTSSSGSYVTYNGTQVLGTDKGIVGIELLVNGTPQTMGVWFNVAPDAQPTLQVQLVQVSTTNSSNVVSGDTFNASGTLMLAFN
ncbi:TPA: fimbrial protein [Citrobacter freundii]|nr:fimbrial protein [Citrobacter farmeri]HAT2286997.1 fimbrial protein [Citrobacter freundii]HAT2350490.1 fimbrial protein [Citrobacter freundii]HAT2432580.1 fimbrial protein [Citrobacter freundii]HAT2501680.1 fimbrial protein [Citrobacter freundii]